MWLEAVRAAEEKQARNIRVLDLREVTSFADYFVIASGANSRQIQAIADEIHQRLKKLGEMPNSMEGYDNADWILMDYGDYLIHIFSEKARLYYDLERLWRDAKTVEFVAATYIRLLKVHGEGACGPLVKESQVLHLVLALHQEIEKPFHRFLGFLVGQHLRFQNLQQGTVRTLLGFALRDIDLTWINA
jgi:ribosome-associated protein